MAERLYRIRNPSGSEYGPLGPTDICALIGTGRIMLDAVASETPNEKYIPITQFPLFAKAFEARFGLDGAPRGSDSTPSSASASGDRTLSDARAQVEDRTPISVEAQPITIQAVPAVVTGANEEPRTPITQSSPALDDSMSGELSRQEVVIGGQGSGLGISDPVIGAIGSIGAIGAIGAIEAAEGPPPLPTVPLAPAFQPPLAAIPPAASTTILVGTSESRRGATVAILGWAVIVALLYALSVGTNLGAGEARYLATSGLFYLRILLLFTAGVGLSALFLRHDPVTVHSFSISSSSALVAAGIGMISGALSPLAPLAGSPVPIALSMTFLHAVAEETFFRGYLDRVLAQAFPEIVSRTAIGATLFGVYCLTYGSLWHGRSAMDAILWACALTIIAGLPLSLLFHRSKSFLVPLVCHLALNISMIAMSYLRA